jgi:hypothetical protein
LDDAEEIKSNAQCDQTTQIRCDDGLGHRAGGAAIEKRGQAQLRARESILKVAPETRVGVGTVQRIKQEMTGPFAAAAA